MRCTELSSGIKCARISTPADTDVRFSYCGCGGGLGNATSAKFKLGLVHDLHMVWTGLALPGFLASFFLMGGPAQPCFGRVPALRIPYVSTCGSHVNFNGKRDFRILDPFSRQHWSTGRWSGIIDTMHAGLYTFLCSSTHSCSV